MALWGVDKLQARRVQAPKPGSESGRIEPPSRESIEERLLLFQTGKALESPLRFMKWAERTGTAHEQRDLAFERDEAERAMEQIKRLLKRDPQSAIVTQGDRVPERAMELTRPMRDPA